MRDVRDGHIKGKIERIVPILVAIHRSRAETSRRVPVNVSIDASCPAQEFLVLQIEAPVMIQVVHIEFKPAASNFTDILIRDLVALLGNDLKRSLDSVRIVQMN